MKKTGIIILLMLAVFCLAGCGSTTSDSTSLDDYHISEAGTWKDGTYTATASGKNGDFNVTVVIQDGVMTDIEVQDHNETPDKGGVAIETISEEILKDQSPDVDGVTGATVTSNALKKAVAECLEEASE